MANGNNNDNNYVNISEYQSNVNPDLASEVLDTNISELLPDQGTRQGRIDTWFAEFFNLIPPSTTFTSAEVETGTPPILDTNWDGISENPNNSNASITRLIISESAVNANKSIESFRNQLDMYLQDVDYLETAEEDDGRPVYQDKSSGFLKIRNLNQSILIKQEEGKEMSFAELATDEEGEKPRWQIDGFTITMWVRFKDKINGGTLFNYGNPTRLRNPIGFKLETFSLKEDDIQVPGSFEFEDETEPFQKEQYERFVRLVVRDHSGYLRDSHVGLPVNDRLDTTSEGIPEVLNDNASHMLNYTRIPIDFDEWYFIVANYNPDIDESIGEGTSSDGFENNPDYWRWNRTNDGYQFNSGKGAKCKVEVISKSDLIRARGFKQ